MAKATKFVLLLLLALTVLAPVVFYTDRVSTNADQRQDFDRDVGNAERAIENDKLNALRQEILSSMKERVRDVVSEKSGQVAKSLIKSGNKGSATTKVQKHRNRGVLSHTTAASGPGSKDEGLRRQVTSQKTQDGGSVMVSSDEQEKAAGSHRHSSPEIGSKLELVRKLVVEKSQAEDRNSKSNGTALPDARVRYIRDQLIKGRVYLGIGVLQTNRNYHRDLRQRIRVVQRVLGDSSKDSDLPSNANEKVKALEQALAKGQHIQDDGSIAIKRLRAMLHLVDQQLRAHKKQSVFLTQLAAKTLSKGLHCLPLRLTSEYFSLDPGQQQFPNQERLEDPKLYHYALFSDNILAAAVVVNSTVSNAKHPSDHVFHIVTDRLNYAPMRMWFLSSPPGNATIEVRNIEEFTWLNASYSPVLKQLGSRSMVDYYFRTKHAKSDGLLKYRNPKYISILNHLRFYLPELYPKLNKVVFLDDDIIVKKDLASLWSIDLKGKVNGAVETCGESFHHFNRYLNFSNPVIAKNFDPHACGWAFGMNVFDLAEWRRQNITKIYHSWQKLNRNRLLWKLGTLPPGLITFWNRTFPLDRSWHVLGLGYNPHVSSKEIEKAAVIHYNGNMKPWLEIGMPKYRKHWSKYVDYDQVYLHECNINP